MPTLTPLPKYGAGPGAAGSPSPSPSASHRDHHDEQKGKNDPIEKVPNTCPLSASAPVSVSVPLQRPVTPSSSPGPFIRSGGGTLGPASPAYNPLPPPHGPPPPLDAATGAGVSTPHPASRLRTSSSSSGHFVSMTAAPLPDLDHSRHGSTAATGLRKSDGNRQDLALLHVDRTLARLSRLLATVVESHEAQSMLQPLLRRNSLLAQFSLAVLKSAPAGPTQPASGQLRKQQSHHLHHPDHPFLATDPSHAASQARPELQRAHLSAPTILLTAPSRESDTEIQPDAASIEQQNGNPDEVWNLAEDLAAIASLLCDLANPRHISVSLDCPNVILPFRGPHLLSSRHLILVAGYCLGIIADHGHLAISLHWPTGWGAETTMHMGEHQTPAHPSTGSGAATGGGHEQGINIGSFAGTQEMDAKHQRPIVYIRASPMLPHYQQHVPTVADLPTPFVSSVRMRCRVNQPGSQHPSPDAASTPNVVPPITRRTSSSTAPIPTSSPSPPGSSETAQLSPIKIPSTAQDPLNADSIDRPASQTSSLESRDLTTASTTTSDMHCSLTIEIQLPLTSVPRSIGAQPHSLHNPAVLLHPLANPPTPTSSMFSTINPPPPQPADQGTQLETRTDILEAFASSLNGHPIGCFPSAAVLHSLHLGVIPYPMRNVSHFPRLSVVHLAPPLLKHLVTALRQLPRQEPIGVLAILDSDDQVLDVFEWLEAATATASAAGPHDNNRHRQHTHLDGSHNLVLHIAPNPPCTLLLLESLIVLNATLHLFRGVRGAATAGAMGGASPAAAAAQCAAAGLASATTSSVRHWGSPAPAPAATSPMASPGRGSPTDPAIAEWERTMDMLAEMCGVVGGEVDEGSMDSACFGRFKEVPAPSVAPPPQQPRSVSSSSSVAAGPSSRVMSPLPQYPATSPPTPAPVHQYATLNPAHHACAVLSPPAAAAPMHRRITLSNIPESIAALGSKLLSPYVPLADMRIFPTAPAAAFADTSAYSFTSDAQRLWSPLVPMRSLTMVPPGMYHGGAGELQLQLPSVAAGLRPPPLVPLDAQGGLSGTRTRQSVLRRKSDESLRGLFPLVRVLVVEDDPIATRILSIFLARRSIDHVTATTGPQAIDHFTHSGPFHVVLMNLGLAQQPGKDAMDGLECTRAMRQLELERGGAGAGTGARGILPPAVIIALTADTSADTYRAALVAGCNDVAVKPFRLRWIEDKLVEVAALMGLVQPAMEMRELAAVVGDEQGRDGEVVEAEERRKRRERARTWAEQVKRHLAAGKSGAGEQVSQASQPVFQRLRSASADVQIAGGQVDVRDDELWGGELTAEGRAARARTSSYQGPLPVSVDKDKQQETSMSAMGDQVGLLPLVLSTSESVEE